MRRRIDWPERLCAFIDARRFEPFEWGRNDCAMFPSDGIYLMTDFDPAKDFRGRYSDERGVLALIAEFGNLRAFAAHAQLDDIHAGLAQRGDVVLVELFGRDTFGLVAGNGCWCAPGKSGLVFRPMSEVKTAFRV
jgi:hypothetical protein